MFETRDSQSLVLISIQADSKEMATAILNCIKVHDPSNEIKFQLTKIDRGACQIDMSILASGELVQTRRRYRRYGAIFEPVKPDLKKILAIGTKLPPVNSDSRIYKGKEGLTPQEEARRRKHRMKYYGSGLTSCVDCGSEVRNSRQALFSHKVFCIAKNKENDESSGGASVPLTDGRPYGSKESREGVVPPSVRRPAECV